MTVTVWVLIGFCLIALVLHASSIGAVWARGRRPAPVVGRHGRGQVVSVIRPVCGLEDLEQMTLASSFQLTWPETELWFCVASAADPAVAFLERLIAAHAGSNARILIGDNCETANPKLNNLIKGWQAAQGEWIILADSNLLLPPDYVERLLARFTPDAGLVCAPPIASQPRGFWAEVECGFLNTYQGRWQYAADALGFGFAQGKSMLWRRADLDRLGGIAALGSELAEDAAATKLVRASGRKVRLAGPSFQQPIGERCATRVINRQTRWAQLRRMTFPRYFLPEILTGSLPPAVAATLAGELLGGPGVIIAVAFVSVWLGLEALLARAAGWPLSWRSPFAWLLRDALIPLIWLRAFTAGGYEWRGNRVSIAGAGTAALSPGTA
ncbi:MAG TPA: glycosyltransferase [Hyphomicrobiaceae bacterium]|nr:glycosyltransferase [Hyphomicrobiaceae bacterium]